MQHLDNYRRVRITVQCPHVGELADWTQHTTRTAKQMSDFGATVAQIVCDDKSASHQRLHSVTVLDLAEEDRVGVHA